MKNRKSHLIGLSIILVAFNLQAQVYKYSAPLGSVKASGYCRIPLKPEVAGRCHTDFHDIRIRETKGKDLPYLIDVPEENISTNNYIPFEVSNPVVTKSATTYIVDRNTAKDKSNIVIRLANADVNKQIRVEGADVQGQWFVVQSSITLNPSLLSGQAIRETTLDLPETRYRYLRFTLNDSLTGRVRILGFGYYSVRNLSFQAFQLPTPTISYQGDFANPIKIKYNQPFIIDRITFEIEYNGYFYRECSVSRPTVRKDRPGEVVASCALASYFQENAVQFAGINTKELWLNIENGDNPPLKIKKVIGWQKPVYLIVNLEAGKSYQIFYGSDSAKAPVYDLIHFQDKLGGNLPEVKIGTPVATEIPVVEKKYSFWKSRLFLWLGIGSIVLLLGVFTIRMVKEMGEKNGEEPI
jgi:hypothetical protein